MICVMNQLVYNKPLASNSVKSTHTVAVSSSVKPLSEICVDVLKKVATGSDCLQTFMILRQWRRPQIRGGARHLS